MALSAIEIGSAALVRIGYDETLAHLRITSPTPMWVSVNSNKLTLQSTSQQLSQIIPSVRTCICYPFTTPCKACEMCPKCEGLKCKKEEKQEYKTEWIIPTTVAFCFITLRGTASVLMQRELICRNKEVTFHLHDSSCLRLQDKTIKHPLSLMKCNFLTRTIVLNTYDTSSVDGAMIWTKALRINAQEKTSIVNFGACDELDAYTKGSPNIQINVSEKCDVNKAHGVIFAPNRVPNPNFTPEALVMTQEDHDVTKVAPTKKSKKDTPPAYEDV